MSQVNWIHSLSSNLLTQEAKTSQGHTQQGAWQQTKTTKNLMLLLKQERASMMQDDIAETLENMSLALGGKAKGFKLESADTTSTLDVEDATIEAELIQIIKTLGLDLSPEQQQRLRGFEQLALSSQMPLDALIKAGLSPMEAAFVLAQLLSISDPRRNQRLRQAFYDLLNQESWLIAAYLSGLKHLPSEKQALTELHESLKREHISLSGIYQHIKRFPQRKKHLKMMIARFALDLVRTPEAELDPQLIHLLDDMRRLLILLGFEENCEKLCHTIKRAGGPECEPDSLTELLLNLIDQTWFHPDALLEKLHHLGIRSDDLQFITTQRVYEVIKYLPEICFTDADQKLQMLEGLEELLYDLSD